MKNKTPDNGQGDSALEMLSNVATSPAPCVHGHINCSDRIGGECSDELLSRLDRDNDGGDLENVRTIIKHGYLTRTDENGLTLYANRKTDENGTNVITWEYSPPLSMPLS